MIVRPPRNDGWKLLAVSLLALSLTSCGHKGNLKTPSQAELDEQKKEKAAQKDALEQQKAQQKQLKEQQDQPSAQPQSQVQPPSPAQPVVPADPTAVISYPKTDTAQ